MTVHQHPLAYLLGLEGIALMRAFAGEHDAAFTRARIEEVRALLDRAEDFGDGVDLQPIPVAEGYDSWAPRYDGPGNPFFALDESVLLPLIDTLPPGDAVDVMCGTGRYAAHLAQRGHRVRGYDSSPGMLAVARAALPDVELVVGDVADLPAADDSADLVVNALAINHVDDLGPALAETARVLRPGGRLLLCSMPGYFLGSRLSPLLERDSRGEIGYIPEWDHSTGEILRAALGAGFAVLDCQELVAAVSADEYDGAPEPTPGRAMSIWDLHPWVPVAASAVRDDRVCLVVWHFRLR
ncbi:MAG: hypothetical protein AVDCRST_MAG60-879 [uncultured Nocardioides sp.]|uniref:Methyltransferase type 11 domain-containing protein n=1 Tax=uncultured Nocardioides sp. TaxID=198441 RepID=A0A6J4NEV0_9ACTN|nr:MAG: hypothetical protein AVDCRST_MAG60-879 [uncultured Nocardioides sp.]